MAIRRIMLHEECLKSFANALKREAKADIRAWQKMNLQEAESRRRAYVLVVDLLVKKAGEHNIPIADLGLVDFNLPKSNDQEEME